MSGAISSLNDVQCMYAALTRLPYSPSLRDWVLATRRAQLNADGTSTPPNSPQNETFALALAANPVTGLSLRGRFNIAAGGASLPTVVGCGLNLLNWNPLRRDSRASFATLEELRSTNGEAYAAPAPRTQGELQLALTRLLKTWHHALRQAFNERKMRHALLAPLHKIVRPMQDNTLMHLQLRCRNEGLINEALSKRLQKIDALFVEISAATPCCNEPFDNPYTIGDDRHNAITGRPGLRRCKSEADIKPQDRSRLQTRVPAREAFKRRLSEQQHHAVTKVIVCAGYIDSTLYDEAKSEFAVLLEQLNRPEEYEALAHGISNEMEAKNLFNALLLHTPLPRAQNIAPYLLTATRPAILQAFLVGLSASEVSSMAPLLASRHPEIITLIDRGLLQKRAFWVSEYNAYHKRTDEITDRIRNSDLYYQLCYDEAHPVVNDELFQQIDDLSQEVAYQYKFVEMLILFLKEAPLSPESAQVLLELRHLYRLELMRFSDDQNVIEQTKPVSLKELTAEVACAKAQQQQWLKVKESFAALQDSIRKVIPGDYSLSGAMETNIPVAAPALQAIQESFHQTARALLHYAPAGATLDKVCSFLEVWNISKGDEPTGCIYAILYRKVFLKADKERDDDAADFLVSHWCRTTPHDTLWDSRLKQMGFFAAAASLAGQPASVLNGRIEQVCKAAGLVTVYDLIKRRLFTPHALMCFLSAAEVQARISGLATAPLPPSRC